MKGFLLDTNQVGEATDASSPVLQRIYEQQRRGVKVGTCIPVLCEIESGRLNLANPNKYLEGLNRLLRKVRIWPLTPATAQFYGEIRNDLRKRGRALSQVDMMLAALCREMELVLVTADKDFEALAWLKTETWTS